METYTELKAFVVNPDYQRQKQKALAGLTEPVSGPEWAVACGLIRMQCNGRDRHLETQGRNGGIFAWIRNALGDFFEMGGGHDRI